LRPGGYYLLYTFLAGAAPANPPPNSAVFPSRETPSISYEDIAAFAPSFALRWTAHGEDHTRHSAWFLLQRV
jgi:hypothetical protein